MAVLQVYYDDLCETIAIFLSGYKRQTQTRSLEEQSDQGLVFVNMYCFCGCISSCLNLMGNQKFVGVS